MQSLRWLRCALTHCIDGNVDRWVIWYDCWSIHGILVCSCAHRLSIAVDNDRGVGSAMSWQFFAWACTYIRLPLQIPNICRLVRLHAHTIALAIIIIITNTRSQEQQIEHRGHERWHQHWRKRSHPRSVRIIHIIWENSHQSNAR